MPIHDIIRPVAAHPLPTLTQISVAGVDIARITYRGEPVVTLGEIDRLHQRIDGTAARALRDNRERFTDGVDVIAPTSDEIRGMCDFGILPDRTARVILLTRRGYLKIVKVLSDDRAWDVQGEMIERFFAFEQGVQLAAFNPSDPNHVLTLISHYAEESKRAQEQIAARDRALEEAEPAIRFSADVAAAANGVKLETAARSFRPGRNTFYNLLRRDGILLQGKPIRPSSEYKHHFRVETRVAVEQDGQSRIRESYRLTGAGFQWLRTRYADLLLPNDDDPNLIDAEGAETGEAD